MKGEQENACKFSFCFLSQEEHTLCVEKVCEKQSTILQGAGDSWELVPFPPQMDFIRRAGLSVPHKLAAQLCFSCMVSVCKEMVPQGEGTFPVKQLKFSLWQQETLSSPYLLDLLASMQACCWETTCCLMGAWSLKLLPEFCWDRQDSVNSTPDRESLIWTHFGMLLCACSLPGGCSSKLINFCDLNHSLLLVVSACAVLHSYRWCALSGDPISMPL